MRAQSSASCPGDPPDGAQDPHVGPAAAEVSVERRAELGVARPRTLLQQRRGCHDHAVDAVPALGSLLGDECLLEWMGMLAGAQALERRHGPVDRGHRRHTRARGAIADVDGAGTALGQATPELRAIQSELFAKHVQERRVSGGGHPMTLPVDRDLERIRHEPGLYVSTPPHARDERHELIAMWTTDRGAWSPLDFEPIVSQTSPTNARPGRRALYRAVPTTPAKLVHRIGPAKLQIQRHDRRPRHQTLDLQFSRRSEEHTSELQS